MDIKQVENAVEEAYDVKVNSIEKIKNVYKVHSSDNQYCLKVINYNFGHFLFIISAIRHLQNNGFNNIPQIIKTKNGLDYINLKDSYFYLTKWVNSRQCNYDNPIEILFASSKLAELHKKSKNFELSEDMKPRIGWFKWIETFNTRKGEILDFKRKIDKKEQKTEFDQMYLDMMEEELERVDTSLTHLKESEYLDAMKSEIEERGFCHHDYANHNVLIDTKGEVNIIDFDYCILDTHLHDLASLLIRRMKNGKWSIGNSLFILEAYGAVNQVKKRDIPIMAAFMEFPQDYWQLGIQYYWEKQPWGEEFFLKKLRKINADKDEKQEFIDEFRYFNYD